MGASGVATVKTSHGLSGGSRGAHRSAVPSEGLLASAWISIVAAGAASVGGDADKCLPGGPGLLLQRCWREWQAAKVR